MHQLLKARSTSTDPSMAPKDHDAFYVLVPVPNNLSGIDWSKEGERFRDLVIRQHGEDYLAWLKGKYSK